MVSSSSRTSDKVDPAVYRVGGLVWDALAPVGILGDGGLVLLGGASCSADHLGPWLDKAGGLKGSKYRGIGLFQLAV